MKSMRTRMKWPRPAHCSRRERALVAWAHLLSIFIVFQCKMLAHEALKWLDWWSIQFRVGRERFHSETWQSIAQLHTVDTHLSHAWFPRSCLLFYSHFYSLTSTGQRVSRLIVSIKLFILLSILLVDRSVFPMNVSSERHHSTEVNSIGIEPYSLVLFQPMRAWVNLLLQGHSHLTAA